MEKRELKRNRRSLTGHKLSCSILAIGQEFVENIEGRGSSCNLLVWNMEMAASQGERGGKSLWLMVVDTLEVESLSWITLEPLSQDNFLGAGPLSWMAFKLLSQCKF